jgi:uncharacterized membrane protein YjgN (DUF898 family)
MASFETSAPVQRGDVSPLVFVNRPGLLGLLLKNLGLTIITLGIYRFWARTALRRYWWSSVVIDGDPLEYTGTGAELFLGFLFFLVVISPFGLLWVLLKVFAADVVWQSVLGFGFYIFLLFILLPVALFRARRYRLSRTRWRGIRGGMHGSTWRFLGIAVAGFLATVLTAGIAMPWMRISQYRYITNCSSFGDRSLSFDGKSGGLILRWLAVILLPIVLGVIGVAQLLRFLGEQAAALESGLQPDLGAVHAGGLNAGTGLIWAAMLIFILGFVWYSACEFRYMLNHTRIGGMRVQSRLGPWTILGYVVAFFFLGFIALILVVLVLVFLVAMIVAIATGGQLMSHLPTSADPSGSAPMAILAFIWVFFGIYVFALIAFGIARILILDKAIVRMLVATAALTGADELTRIGPSTAPLPGTGEGMADAFDLGAF